MVRYVNRFVRLTGPFLAEGPGAANCGGPPAYRRGARARLHMRRRMWVTRNRPIEPLEFRFDRPAGFFAHCFSLARAVGTRAIPKARAADGIGKDGSFRDGQRE